MSSLSASEPLVTLRKRERRKDARPDEIIDAALDVFADKGFAAAKLDDIAARANISKGTLYLYFASKEDLLKAVVRERVVSLLSEGRELVAHYEGSTAALLSEFMLTWWERQGETNSSAIQKIITSEAVNFPEVARFYHSEVIEPAHVILRALLKRGVDRGEFAPIGNYDDAIHAIVSGVMFVMNWKHSFACCVEGQHIEPKSFIANFAHILIHGLAQRNDAPGFAAQKTKKPL